MKEFITVIVIATLGFLWCVLVVEAERFLGRF